MPIEDHHLQHLRHPFHQRLLHTPQIRIRPQPHQARAAQPERRDRPLQAQAGLGPAAGVGWRAQQLLDPNHLRLPHRHQAQPPQPQHQQGRQRQPARPQLRQRPPQARAQRLGRQQAAQALGRIGRQQRAVLQEPQKQLVPQGAAGVGAAAQLLQQGRQQPRQPLAQAGGHLELGVTLPVLIQGVVQQLEQGLAHRRLLGVVQLQDQRQPQPIRHEAVA